MEELSDVENQILAMIYSGAFDLSNIPEMASGFGMDEDEMAQRIAHLTEIGMLESDDGKKLTRNIKYVMLSKSGVFGGKTDDA